MISLRNRRQNLSEKQKNKINEIREALNNNDIYSLRNLSRTEGGFVTSELRKLCWPFLLHVDVSNIRISEKKDIISNIEDDSSINNSNIESDNENNNQSNNENGSLENSSIENINSTENGVNNIIEEEKNNNEKINDDPIIREDSNQNDKNTNIKNEDEKENNKSEENINVEQENSKAEENINVEQENNKSEENVNVEQEIDNEQIELAESNKQLEEQEKQEDKIEQNDSTETNNIENVEVQNEQVNEKDKPEEIGKEVVQDEIIEIVDKNNIENNDIKIENDESKEVNIDSKDDINSETLKDDNNESIEAISQENIIVPNQDNNDPNESIEKIDNISENSDNEDYTKNNHSDDESDDVLFKGELDIKASEIHESHYKDNGENKEIFDNSLESLDDKKGKEEEEKQNEDIKQKKCVAKDIILDSDDDPERMDKLKQIENESKYRDKRQIMLDVNRAFVHFPKGLKAKEKTVKQIELSHVILYSLKDHSYLHYYQGYHDICSLLLLVLGEDIAKPCAETLALYWLREYMKETLEPTLEVMSLLYPILKYADPKIYKLVYNNMIPPYFSISWVITWCIHDLRDTSEMERIFDFFISNNPIMPIYFAAAVILTQKEKLYNRFPQILNEENEGNEEDETDPETAMPNFSVVHQFLTNLLPIATSQTKDVTVDSAVELAWNLYEQYPLKFLMKKESVKLNPLCCVNRYYKDCETVLPNKPFNKEEIIKLLKKEEEINLKNAMATPNSKNTRMKKIQEKADIIGNYLSQRITIWTIATTLILVTAIILTHEFSKTYYM